MPGFLRFIRRLLVPPFLLSPAVALWTCPARAIPPPLALPLDPPLTHLSQAEGLSSDQVRSTLQDRRGNLWIATQQGLDGYQDRRFIAHFNAGNTVLLPDARLTAMAQDAQGRLWFGTYGGLVLYTRAGFTTFTRASGLADNRLTCALADPQNRLWLGTWKGLALRTDQGFKSLSLPTTPVSALLMDRSGHLWVGYARDGLWRSDSRDLAHFRQVQGPYPVRVHTLCEDHGGRVWIGSVGNGLLRCDPQAWSMAPAGLPGRGTQTGLGAASVLCLQEDHQGGLWAGTDHGLYRLVDGTWQAVSLDRGDPPRIKALCADREQRLWIGTWDRGLWRQQEGSCSRVEELADRRIHALLQDRQQRLWATTDRGLYGLQDDTWKHFSVPALPAVELEGLLEDRQGNLWISTQEHGLLRFDGRRFTHFSPTHHLPQAEIHAQAQTPDSTLWLGTAAGLVAYDGEQFLPYGPEAGLPHSAVYALAVDPDSSLWIGTGAGLARWQEGHIATVVPASELPGPAVRALAVSQGGDLWIGTSAGLVQLRENQRQVFTRADGLPHDPIRALALDPRHRLWIATSAGLATFDQGHFRTFTTADGLTSDLLFTVLCDREGGVWAGSLAGGAVRYDGQSFYRLTAQEGLPSNVVRHISQDAEGHIWLATDKGLVRFHRDAVPPLPYPSKWVWGLSFLALLALAAAVYSFFGLRRFLFRLGRSAGS